MLLELHCHTKRFRSYRRSFVLSHSPYLDVAQGLPAFDVGILHQRLGERWSILPAGPG